MKGHAGAVLTSAFAAIALALVALQAMVLAQNVPRQEATAVHSGTTNRYSAPGGRSGVPWLPFDKAQPADKPVLPEDPEGRKPPTQRQEQHQSPPPPRFRSVPPRLGPTRPRSAVACPAPPRNTIASDVQWRRVGDTVAARSAHGVPRHLHRSPT